MSAEDALIKIAGEVASCTKCNLHHSRKYAVPGEGPSNAEIMLIGEGPGFHENEQGRPFVGAAGKFLEELLTSIGLTREDVFITPHVAGYAALSDELAWDLFRENVRRFAAGEELLNVVDKRAGY